MKVNTEEIGEAVDELSKLEKPFEDWARQSDVFVGLLAGKVRDLSERLGDNLIAGVFDAARRVEQMTFRPRVVPEVAPVRLQFETPVIPAPTVTEQQGEQNLPYRTPAGWYMQGRRGRLSEEEAQEIIQSAEQRPQTPAPRIETIATPPEPLAAPPTRRLSTEIGTVELTVGNIEVAIKSDFGAEIKSWFKQILQTNKNTFVDMVKRQFNNYIERERME